MRFEYVPYGGSWLPPVPVVFKYKKRSLPALGALGDTRATHTILPLEIAPQLGIHIHLNDRIETQVAGGGQCLIYPSSAPIDYLIRDPNSRLECQWHGLVFFALGQRLVLLGHHQCLEKADLTFRGPDRVTELLPRLRTE